jgi:ribosome maturation factor RimP
VVARNAELLAEVESLLAASEYEVVDVQCTGSSRGLVVRIYVDKEEGVSIEDCARVSRAVGDHFEARGTFPGRYVLEVSSPGVDRPLRGAADYRRFAGETAVISTHEKIDGRHNHQGVLEGFDDDRQEIVLHAEDGSRVALPLGAVKKAHLKRDPWRRGTGKERDGRGRDEHGGSNGPRRGKE